MCQGTGCPFLNKPQMMSRGGRWTANHGALSLFRHKRQELVEAAQKDLRKIAAQVQRRDRHPLKASEIALKVGKVINRYKVGKHFVLTIQDGLFQWRRDEESIEREARLDGIYVIRIPRHPACGFTPFGVR